MSSKSEFRGSILLVEDSEAVRHAFGLLLRDSGYDVMEAGTGREAVDSAKSAIPDIVLLDLGLPDMKGLDVARELKKDPRTEGISIIALTGRALDSDRLECAEAGCAMYLTKPVDSAHLLRTLDDFMATRGV